MAKKKEKKEESTEVVEREEAGELAVIDYTEAEQGGFEDVTSKDFKIPLLRVLQALSPEVDDEDPRHIEGAKPGSLYNISTKKVYSGKDGVKLIPCKFFRRWVEWVDRDEGGGYVDEYDIKDPIYLSAKKVEGKSYLKLENGHHLVETGYFPCIMILEDGSVDEVVISVSSSGFNFSKEWLSTIRGRSMKHPRTGKPFTPAFWSHVYTVGSETKKNQKHSWKGFCVKEFEVLTDKSLYERAAEFNRQMNLSMVKMGGDKDEAAAGSQGPKANAAEEEAY